MPRWSLLNLSEPPFPQAQNSISVPVYLYEVLSDASWALTQSTTQCWQRKCYWQEALNCNNEQLSLWTTSCFRSSKFLDFLIHLSPFSYVFYTQKHCVSIWWLVRCNSITPRSQQDYFHCVHLFHPLCTRRQGSAAPGCQGKGPDWNPSSTLHQLLGKASTFSLLSWKMFIDSWDIYLCIFLLNSCYILAY